MEDQLYCRLCLEEEALQKMDDSVISCVKNKLSIEIRDDDNLSKEICAQCYEMVEFYKKVPEFKERVSKKQKLLHKIIQPKDLLSVNVQTRTNANAIINEAPVSETISCPSTSCETDITDTVDSSMDTNAISKSSNELINEIIKSIDLDEVERKEEELKQISNPNNNFRDVCKNKPAKYQRHVETEGHRLGSNIIRKCGDPDIFLTNTLGYRCEICTNTFSSETAATSHIRNVHKQSVNKKNLKPVAIPKNNKNSIDVKKNEKSRLPEVKVKDEPDTVDVNTNPINFNRLKKHPCKYCTNKSFGFVVSLQRHIKKHHKDVHLCTHCNFTTKINKSLTNHIRKVYKLTHSQRVCSTCFKIFNSQTDVISHRKVNHIAKTSPICSVCNASFTNSVLLKKHRRNVHFISGKRFKSTVQKKRRFLRTKSSAKSAPSDSVFTKSKILRVQESTKKIDTPLENCDDKIQGSCSPLLRISRIESTKNKRKLDFAEHSIVKKMKTVPEERKSELNAKDEKISDKKKKKSFEAGGNSKTSEQHPVVDKMKIVPQELSRQSTSDSVKNFNPLSTVTKSDNRRKSCPTTSNKISDQTTSIKQTKINETRNISGLNSTDEKISEKQTRKSTEAGKSSNTLTEQHSEVEKMKTVPEELVRRSTSDSVKYSNALPSVAELDKRGESCKTTFIKITDQSTGETIWQIVEPQNKSELNSPDENISGKPKRKSFKAEKKSKKQTKHRSLVGKVKTVSEKLACRNTSDSVKHFNPFSSVTESDKNAESFEMALTKLDDHSTNIKQTKTAEKRSKFELNKTHEKIIRKRKRKSSEAEENSKKPTEHIFIDDSEREKNTIYCGKCGLSFKNVIQFSQHDLSVHFTSAGAMDATDPLLSNRDENTKNIQQNEDNHRVGPFEASTYDYVSQFRAPKRIHTLPPTNERNNQTRKQNERIVDRSAEILGPAKCSIRSSSQSTKICELSERIPEQVAYYSNYPSLSQKKDVLSCDIQKPVIYPSKLDSSLKEIGDPIDRSVKTQGSEHPNRTSSIPKENYHRTDRYAKIREFKRYPYLISKINDHTRDQTADLLLTPKKGLTYSIPSTPESPKLRNHQFEEETSPPWTPDHNQYSLNPNASPTFIPDDGRYSSNTSDGFSSMPVTETRRRYGAIVTRPAVNSTSSFDLRSYRANDSKITDFRRRNTRLHVDTTASDENNDPLKRRQFRSNTVKIRHREVNVRSKSFVGLPYWSKVTLYYGRKYDRSYLMSELKNYVKPVLFTPFGTLLEGDNLVFFVDNKIASKAIGRANLKLETADGCLLEIKVEYKMPIVCMTTTLKKKIARVIASKYDDNAQHLDLSKFYLNEDFIKQDLLVLLNRPNVALAVFQSINENIAKLKSLNLSNNSIYSTKHLSLLKNHAGELKSIDLSKNRIKELNHLRCLEELKLDSLMLNSNPLRDRFRGQKHYVREVREIFPTLSVLDGFGYRRICTPMKKPRQIPLLEATTSTTTTLPQMLSPIFSIRY